MTSLLRKSFTASVLAASLGAMTLATASPAAADWRGRGHGRGGWGPGVAAGVIGGLALGAMAAGAARQRNYPVYEEPRYYDPAPVYGYEADPGPVCHKEWRPVYRADGVYLRDRQVTVCD